MRGLIEQIAKGLVVAAFHWLEMVHQDPPPTATIRRGRTSSTSVPPVAGLRRSTRRLTRINLVPGGALCGAGILPG